MSNKAIKSHTGHPLTPKEDKFISNYIETGNQRQSVIKAEYKTKAPSQYANDLLNKNYIKEEIEYRMGQIRKEKIASTEEIMEYFSNVLRGEVKDQFGLEAPLSERTKAAVELAKRTIDIENKINGKDTQEVKITLDWKREG